MSLLHADFGELLEKLTEYNGLMRSKSSCFAGEAMKFASAT
jgi:hypothetical protein